MASNHVFHSYMCSPKIDSSKRPKSSKTGLKWVNSDFSALKLNRDTRTNASITEMFENVIGRGNHGFAPFRGKPGSISFYGFDHIVVEQEKLEPSSLKTGSGSCLWLVGSAVLMLSYILPPVLVGSVVNIMISDMVLAEIVVSMSSEAAFYAGFAAFLIITDHVQRPFSQSSAKRWSLITQLRGYSLSTFSTTALKILVPIYAICISWPELGLEGLVAVTPFIVGCLAQIMFEVSVKIRGSSCWPLVPIIFEMYRIYQVTRGVYFIERLVYAMADLPKTPRLMERGNALVGMVVMLQILALVCLWSLITFLVRLFPSESF